jgi:hypothetical protein
MDLMTLVANAQSDGSFARIGTDPLAQFNANERNEPTYLGALLWPERLVPENDYTDEGITYKTIVANAGTRYSSTQKKGAELYGSMKVSLGESDLSRELNGRDYDALVRMLRNDLDEQGMATMLNWADVTLNRALVEFNEMQRWQAALDARVLRKGNDNYFEQVDYPNPSGHRVTIAGGTLASKAGWYDPTHDPVEDIFSMADLMYSKGYNVARIVTSRTLVSILGKHPLIKSRAGKVVVSTTGQLSGAAGRASLSDINEMLQADGLPPIQIYERRYNTDIGTKRFFREDAFFMAATTGRVEEIDLGDDEPLVIYDTLGYVAVGRGVGQSDPGRFMQVEPQTKKPPRLEGEAWQSSIPVISEPESVGVLTIQKPA